MLSKRGEWIRVHECGEKYGWQFVIDTIDRAVQLKQAESMRKIPPHKMSKKEKEARIIQWQRKWG